MILEGIVTTLGINGEVNIAPMGPEVDVSMRDLVLKPFRTSTTYQNLKRTGEGVLHVTDDVLLLAQAAIGPIDPTPPLIPATKVNCPRLADACRWYEFRVVSLDDSVERTRIVAEVVASERGRDFFGFNRAKHAVVEAAILATRTMLLPPAEILSQFEQLKTLVYKTGGEQEHTAFALLSAYVNSTLRAVEDAETRSL